MTAIPTMIAVPINMVMTISLIIFAHAARGSIEPLQIRHSRTSPPTLASRYRNRAWLRSFGLWQNKMEHAVLDVGGYLTLVNFAGKPEASRIMPDIVFRVDRL